MASATEIRKKLIAMRDEALAWKGRYESDTGKHARQNAMYYDGLVQGYERAIMLIAESRP